MDYKNTLNLPQTDFSMKADLVHKEPLIRQQWEKINLYQKVRHKYKGAPKYILHDGPPYATGDVHVGTGITKLHKDIVVRFKTMQGFDAPFIPGWDCHGLPIEHKVMTQAGAEIKDLSGEEIRKRCRDYALKYVDIEREQFKSLGVLGDWEHPYLTLDHSYEAAVIDVFADLVEKGFIYRGLKTIHWCPHCQTALAEAELVYREKTSRSIYLRFPMETPLSEIMTDVPPRLINLPFSILVWTTTPWTLPANVATAVHPVADYALVEFINPKTKSAEISIAAEALLPSIFSAIKVDKYSVVGKVKGKLLEKKTYRHPLFGHPCPIILANYVTLEDGTGCVHTAPGHGQEDFQSGQEYKLPIISPVDQAGIFTKEAGEFAGQMVFEAEQGICTKLAQDGILLNEGQITHSYPHCWRCKKPVIFRATDQWFIAVDHHQARARALQEVEKVRWVPDWGKVRISSMIKARPDWCVSRQRNWGVPIPAFYCTRCGTVLLDTKIIKQVRDIFSKEGADSWFKHEVSYFLPPNTTCPKCRNKEFKKEKDIFDVWLESGSSHRAVVMQHPQLSFPADLYIEGTDQHRGWFQLSLLPSVMTQGCAPFKTVVTNGFILDEAGEKLSKSKGGLLSVDNIVNDFGAEIYRLWFTSINFTDDNPFSLAILEKMIDPYRKIRNTFRYLLGNLYDFVPEKNRIEYNELWEIDRWALNKLHRLIKTVTQGYEDFEFHKVFREIYNFCVVEMSAFYFDILKDRVYTFARNSQERRSAQTAMYEILINLTKLLAPILVHTTEEIWSHLPAGQAGLPDSQAGLPGNKEAESVHLTHWPEVNPQLISDEIETRWHKLITIRTDVAREIEKLRQQKVIGNALEARVGLFTEKEDLAGFLQTYQADLPMIFIVSQVDLLKEKPPPAVAGIEIPALYISVTRSPSPKCERCWQYHETVGKNPSHPTICQKCDKALEEIK